MYAGIPFNAHIPDHDRTLQVDSVARYKRDFCKEIYLGTAGEHCSTVALWFNPIPASPPKTLDLGPSMLHLGTPCRLFCTFLSCSSHPLLSPFRGVNRFIHYFQMFFAPV